MNAEFLTRSDAVDEFLKRWGSGFLLSEEKLNDLKARTTGKIKEIIGGLIVKDGIHARGESG